MDIWADVCYEMESCWAYQFGYVPVSSTLVWPPLVWMGLCSRYGYGLFWWVGA